MMGLYGGCIAKSGSGHARPDKQVRMQVCAELAGVKRWAINVIDGQIESQKSTEGGLCVLI